MRGSGVLVDRHLRVRGTGGTIFAVGDAAVTHQVGFLRGWSRGKGATKKHNGRLSTMRGRPVCHAEGHALVTLCYVLCSP